MPGASAVSRPSSLQNALRMLRLFTDEEPEFGVSELAERMGVAKSTVHRLATTLASEGFLVKDAHTGRYRLGASVLALGNVITAQMALYRQALPVLKCLVQLTGETAHLCILDGTEVFYLHKVDGKHPVRLLSYVGKRNPAYCTSSGQVLLAYREDEVVERVIAQGLRRYTAKTIACPNQLRKRLLAIRSQGYAVSAEELHEGVTSIAAPIRNPIGEVIAAVNIAGPTSRVNRHNLPQLVKVVIEAGREISRSLGKRAKIH